MFYVYFLQSKVKKDQFYIGYSSNLKQRLDEHNSGKSAATKPYRPWILWFYEAFNNSLDAKRREKYLKTTKGRKALKLMLRGSFKNS